MVDIEGGLNTYAYVGGNPVSWVDPTGEIGLLGAGAGAAIEIGMQALNNYLDGCDLLDVGNYDLADIGIAAATGFVAPGLIKVGKTAFRTRGAVQNLTEQLGRASTPNRIAKIENAIARNKDDLATIIKTQAAFQGAKSISKAVNGNGGRDCTCRR